MWHGISSNSSSRPRRRRTSSSWAPRLVKASGPPLPNWFSGTWADLSVNMAESFKKKKQPFLIANPPSFFSKKPPKMLKHCAFRASGSVKRCSKPASAKILRIVSKASWSSSGEWLDKSYWHALEVLHVIGKVEVQFYLDQWSIPVAPLKANSPCLISWIWFWICSFCFSMLQHASHDQRGCPPSTIESFKAKKSC